jgi:hypothetical protein
MRIYLFFKRCYSSACIRIFCFSFCVSFRNPSSITAGHRPTFRNPHCIFQQLLRLEPYDPQDRLIFVDLLSQITAQCVTLLSHDYDSFFLPIFQIFHAKPVPLFQSNYPTIYLKFCRSFLEKSGLIVVKSRIKSAEPPPKLFHFLIFEYDTLPKT